MIKHLIYMIILGLFFVTFNIIFVIYGVKRITTFSDVTNLFNTLTSYKQWKYKAHEFELNQIQHIKSFRYPAEEHIVETDDGYLLTIIRIPHGKDEVNARSQRPIMYLQPGLCSSAAIYFDLDPKRSLAYLLANMGFDVWIANPRGTVLSLNHTKYDAKTSKEFWNFSWHEIGTIDIPNTIDYILNKTNQSKINYIGHSQGGTVLFVMLAERPEYNSKINLAITLGTINFMEHIVSPYNFTNFSIVKYMNPVFSLLNYLEVYDVIPYRAPLIKNFGKECNYKSTNETLEECKKFWNFIGSMTDVFTPEYGDPRDIGVTLSHFPGGCSLKQLVHYTQLIKTDDFKKFNHGKDINRKIYGQGITPPYNLSNVKATIYLVYSESDWVATSKDIQKLHYYVPSTKLFKIKSPKFKHYDFFWDINIRNVLYNDMFKIIREYND